MRRSELRMGVTLIMEWKKLLARNGANYCEMVQIAAAYGRVAILISIGKRNRRDTN
jgi:hypothetical protein